MIQTSREETSREETSREETSREENDRAGRRLWIGLDGPGIRDRDLAHLERLRPGGIVLFRRNITDLDELVRSIERARDVVGPALHVAVDEEGGAVSRFEEFCPVFPGNAALGLVHETDPSAAVDLAERQGRVLGASLRELGVTVDLAPVIDRLDGESRAIGTRSFGDRVDAVEELGAAIVRGLHDAGVRACLKHFPGLGAAHEDPHYRMARVPRAVALDPHLAPFRSIASRHPEVAIMTTHVVVEPLDREVPATFSANVVDRLRRRFRFDGLVVTDDLGMGAIEADRFVDSVHRSVRAGHDIVLIAEGTERQLAARATIVEWHRSAEGAEQWERVDARLRCYSILPPKERVERETHEALVREIARRAVRVAPPMGHLPGRGVLTLLPRVPESPPEFVLRVGTTEPLREALRSRGSILEYDLCPTSEELAAIAPAAFAASATVFVVAGLRHHAPYRDLLAQLRGWTPELTVVLLGDPRDRSVLEGSGATVVTAGGARPVLQQQVAQLLSGTRSE
ncbi:MAG: glycoside hydrolase family 3 protein [Planctomycetes bacterium]|nr:glycoside hydrolase family 3 protein [Planctomycetota bacterium]